jgi:hypothetical protein
VWPEVTKRFSDTHKWTKIERGSAGLEANQGFSGDCHLAVASVEVTANNNI